jgi:PAS domain S-box-containing protein
MKRGMTREASGETSFVVESTAEAAFAADGEQRIVAWNAAAQGLLGFTAQDVLGRRCHEILSGFGADGSRYCRAACSPDEAARCGRPVKSFALDARRASGEFVRVDVSILVLRDPSTSARSLVHVVRPAADSPEQNDSLESLRWRVRRSRQAVGVEARANSRTTREAAPRDGLTAREVEILRFLVGGCSPREIADRLSVSIATVRTHIRNVRRKLGVHSVTQAVSKALGERLV